MGAADLLGPAGPFAGALSGYEPRSGQLDMAAAVERCLQKDGIAMIEAGTGTGKTLAYLVPALLEGRRKKVVISTATRALQDQIFYKDLPLVCRVLGVDLPVALMKGLPNYVCRRRYQELESSAESLEPKWSRALPLVDAWLDDSATGAIEDLDALAEDDAIWSRIAASSERRIGAGCRFFDTCFVTGMKRRAASAQIVVVNHHLFFADLALRGAHPSSVIPDYDAVIFDEAHQLEDVATEHFGVSVSSARLGRLCSDARPLLERELGVAAGDHARRIQELGEAFYDVLGGAARPSEGRASVPQEAWSGALESAWFALDTALEGLGGRIHAITAAREFAEGPTLAPLGQSSAGDGLAAVARRATQLRDDLESIARGAPGSVVWFESGGRARKLSASPVDLSSIFQSRLFDVVPAIVLTSATLSSGSSSSNEAPGVSRCSAAPAVDGELDALDDAEPSEATRPAASGPFRFQRQRLGLTSDRYHVEELSVPSPFRFEEQALLYLPDDLPMPDDPGFVAAAADRSASLIDMCDGGAFVLTTSLRAMQGVHRALGGRLGQRLLLLQGEAPKATLIERFRVAGNAVLVATLSFWQGVDIPGAALRLVVLEKAPFPVPSDPIMLARSQALSLSGESPFTRLHLPLAQLALKQGFGRLIRSQGDYGVVALLDGRVHRRGYGRRLLEGLPPARRVTDIADVEAFWAARRGPPARSRSPRSELAAEGGEVS
jgi:ATP-dependent DNA helicase DinG